MNNPRFSFDRSCRDLIHIQPHLLGYLDQGLGIGYNPPFHMLPPQPRYVEAFEQFFSLRSRRLPG